MHVLIFDVSVLFPNDSDSSPNSTINRLSGLVCFNTAVVAVGLSLLNINRINVLSRQKKLFYHGIAHSEEFLEHILRDVAHNAGWNKNSKAFFVARSGKPELGLGNKLGLTTIGIIEAGDTPVPSSPEARPAHTLWSLDEVPRVVCSDASVLGLVSPLS